MIVRCTSRPRDDALLIRFLNISRSGHAHFRSFRFIIDARRKFSLRFRHFSSRKQWR